MLNVKHASLVPVVLSSTGGMSECEPALFKRIASMQSTKTNGPHNKSLLEINCHVSFSLLRLSVMCLNDARRVFPSLDPSTSMVLTVAEVVILFG